MKVYLAHPKLEKKYGRWVTKIFESRLDIKVINPFRDIKQKQNIKKIMEKELDIITTVDAVVVVISDAVTRAVHMEALWAWLNEVPVYVLWLAYDKNYSWYEAFATAIRLNLPDLATELVKLKE